MKVYDENAAVATMNEWGSRRQPFLFVVSYDKQASYLLPLNEISSDQCLYCFNGYGNDKHPYPVFGQALSWQAEMPLRENYRKSFDMVMQGLLRGDSYLTNLTCRVPLKTNASLKDIFFLSHAPYRLWLEGLLVCFSPESFVKISGRTIRSFPMKGTIDAQLPHAEEVLMADEKEAAEHATIVDLIRNDLSMVAEDVTVARYRYVERIDTNKGSILQTSSEICGTLPAEWQKNLGGILFSQLPAGSITGAPKQKTMEIIAKAEGYERGFYTGVMGIFNGEEVDSAVMIRFVDQAEDGLYFKAGGGITAQSQWEKEYEEVIGKIYVPFY
ncbi:MAG: aminodeoxychorismate synthase component I [Prevotella sp.]|nr:aminodeoxychorismate synthase component I [Prevotella sp.]